MNEENLIPNSQRTPSELREQARKAGIASGEARRQKMKYKEIAETVLSLKMQKESLPFLSSVSNIAKGYNKDSSIGIKELTVMAQVSKAMEGDTRAFEAIRDMIGENLKEMDKKSKVYRIQVQCPDCKKIISGADVVKLRF